MPPEMTNEKASSVMDVTSVMTFKYHKNTYINQTPYEHSVFHQASNQYVYHYMNGPRDHVHTHMMMADGVASFDMFCEDIGRSWRAEICIDPQSKMVSFTSIIFEIPCCEYPQDMWGNQDHYLRSASFSHYHKNECNIKLYFKKDIASFVRVFFGPEWTFTLLHDDCIHDCIHDSIPHTDIRQKIDALLKTTYEPYDMLPIDKSVGYYDTFERLYSTPLVSITTCGN
jgi:hypothetical protein